MKERRRYLRVNFAIKLVYKTMGVKGEVPLESVNIGGGGIKLHLKESVKVGTLVEFGINLPKNGDLFFALGRIAWQKKTRQKIGAVKNLYETGIEFMKLDVLHKTRLIELVHSLLKEGKK